MTSKTKETLMPTYAVQLVYKGVLEEAEGSNDSARIEVVVLGTDRPANHEEVAALATEYARERA